MSAPDVEEVVRMFAVLPEPARRVALAMALSVFEGRAEWARGQARGCRGIEKLAPLAGLYEMVAESDDLIVANLRRARGE